MIGVLLALYPAPWRRRYGEEFRAVLESRPLGPFDVADVLLGALDARLALRSTVLADNAGGRTMLRIGGVGAIVGAILWVAGFIGANVFHEQSGAWIVLVLTGSIGLLLAFAGLSAFQARGAPRLVWAAFAIPALGNVASIVGLYGMATLADSDAPFIGTWGAWSVWAAGLFAMLVGCVLFATATVRAAVLSRAGAWGLAVSSIVVLVFAGGVNVGDGWGLDAFLLLAAFLVFAGSWVLLGASALRRGPIRAVAAA